jgi:hypothetical protein
MGGDIRNGKAYTYQELIDMLKEKKSDKNFSVVICFGRYYKEGRGVFA